MRRWAAFLPGFGPASFSGWVQSRGGSLKISPSFPPACGGRQAGVRGHTGPLLRGPRFSFLRQRTRFKRQWWLPLSAWSRGTHRGHRGQLLSPAPKTPGGRSKVEQLLLRLPKGFGGSKVAALCRPIPAKAAGGHETWPFGQGSKVARRGAGGQLLCPEGAEEPGGVEGQPQASGFLALWWGVKGRRSPGDRAEVEELLVPVVRGRMARSRPDFCSPGGFNVWAGRRS